MVVQHAKSDPGSVVDTAFVSCQLGGQVTILGGSPSSTEETGTRVWVGVQFGWRSFGALILQLVTASVLRGVVDFLFKY